MSNHENLNVASDRTRSSSTSEPPFFRRLLIFLMLLFIGLFLIMPLTAIFIQAFEKGVSAYFAAISETETLAALRLTLLTAIIVVPVNLIFGVLAAWAIAKFRFPGKSILITFIDLPFAVSPVIAGLIFVVLFGLHGALGP